MITCPKCGSNQVLGAFDDETYDGEWIITWEYVDFDSNDSENMYSYFECSTCGYEWGVDK